MSDHDWAELSREYRRRRGLKQQAVAQDLNVDQSTISRWERGEGEPSLNAKHVILNTLLDAGLALADQSMQFLLEQSGSTVAVWDRDAVLQSCSRRFEREIREVYPFQEIRKQPARKLLGGSDIVERSIAVLRQAGFFEGAVALAVFSFPPFLQDRRRKAGGLVTSSTFPLQLSNGTIAMLSILDHDTLLEFDEEHPFTVTWLSAKDGHSQTVYL